MTLVHEGSIVRTITRLDELLKDFRNAARAIGNVFGLLVHDWDLINLICDTMVELL